MPEGMALSDVEAAIRRHADGQKILGSGDGFVNVLELNMELDAARKTNSVPR